MSLLRDFETEAKKNIPSFRIRFKDNSKLMKILGWLIRPFNQEFMGSYITTLGTTVYFPSKEDLDEWSDTALAVILGHEYVHAHDYAKHGFWGFSVPYLMPQIFAILPILVFIVMGSPWPFLMLLLGYTLGSFLSLASRLAAWVVILVSAVASLYFAWVLTGWWCAALVCALGLMGPWPAKFRTHWELRGYAVNLASVWWVTHTPPLRTQVEGILKQFTGPNYWFMCRDKAKLETEVSAILRRTKSGDLHNESPYDMVYSFFSRHVLPARK